MYDRDNDLHKLLFMPNGLPDGTSLAYYSKGKVVLQSVQLDFLIAYQFPVCVTSVFCLFTEDSWGLQAGKWYSL